MSDSDGRLTDALLSLRKEAANHLDQRDAGMDGIRP
jgi:hypothetical protein